MGLAFADHVVATVALEDWAIALWTWCGVCTQIGFGGEFGGSELGVGRSADLKIAVPALGADAAEGEGAAATDLKFWKLRGVFAGKVAVGIAVAGGDGGSGSSDDGFGAIVAEVVRGMVLGHRGV